MTYDVRAALAALAAEAPVELRRSEQVWVRYRRHRRRKVGLAVGTALAAVVGLATLVAPSSDRSGLVTNEPIPTRTTSPAGAPGQSAPPRAGESSPTALVGFGTSGASGAPFAPPTVSVGRPSAAGAWPAGVIAWSSPTHLNAGDVATLYVFPYAGDNGVDGYTVDWGDGSAPMSRDLGTCPSGTGTDGRRQLQGPTWLNTHPFAANGEYTITVTARFDGCGRAPQTGTTTTKVLVDDASTGITSQAVSGTSVMVDRADPLEPAPRKVALSISEQNADRYASFVFVSWGDGTSDVLRDGVPSWCATTPPALDPGFPMHVEHTYPRAGHYDAYVTVQTATCEGGRGNTGTSGKSLDI
jgi:hypothetical protein